MFFPCIICFILKNGHSTLKTRNENPFLNLYHKKHGKVAYQRVSIGGKRQKNKFLKLKRRRTAGNSIRSDLAGVCKSWINENHTKRLLDLYQTLPLYDSTKELQDHIRYCYLLDSLCLKYKIKIESPAGSP